jgi:hypothetical protein
MAYLPLTGPDVVTDPDIDAAGIDAMQSTAGDVFSGALESNPTVQLNRVLGADIGAQGVDPVSGMSFAAPEPLSPAAELNEKFSIPSRADGSGGLSFTNDLPNSVAQSMYDAKRAELARESVAARRPAGFWSGAATLGSEFAAGALDPGNVAAALIPGVGEDFIAAKLGEGVIGRLAVGAVRGVSQTAPLAAGSYALSQSEQGDMTAWDAMKNVAFGGILGGGLHAMLGGVGDAISPFKSNPARMASGVDAAATALADAPLSIRQAVLGTSIAQLVEGRPVEVAPFFTGNELGGSTRTLADLQGEDAAMLNEPATDQGLNTDLEILRGNKAQPQPPQNFMAALRNFGPIKDDAGELDSLGITSRSNPGLISGTGRSLDDVTQDLHESGWLGTPGGDRPSIPDLLSAIFEDQHGSPRLHPDDAASAAYAQSLRDLDGTLYERGIDLRTTSNADVERALNGEAVDRGPATPADLQAHDDAYAAITRDRFAQAARYASGEPLPEDAAASRMADQAAKAPPSLADEEIAHLENSVRASQAAGDLPQSLPELDAANAGVTRAEAMRAGFHAAANCLAQAGA